MNVQTAIMAFTQSEKIKTGLIWASQSLELQSGLPEKDKEGAKLIAESLMNWILFDVHIAKKAAKDASWEEVEKNIDLAIVMANSGVSHESTYHLTRALSHVTSIAQRSMSFLQKQGCLK